MEQVEDRNVRQFALQGRHKLDVLCQLTVIKGSYEKHAGSKWARQLQDAIDLLINVNEPTAF